MAIWIDQTGQSLKTLPGATSSSELLCETVRGIFLCSSLCVFQVQWNLFKSFTSSSAEDKEESGNKTHYPCKEVEENYVKNLTAEKMKGDNFSGNTS